MDSGNSPSAGSNSMMVSSERSCADVGSATSGSTAEIAIGNHLPILIFALLTIVQVAATRAATCSPYQHTLQRASRLVRGARALRELAAFVERLASVARQVVARGRVGAHGSL